MTVKERLEIFIKSLGLNDTQFQNECKMSKGYINSMRVSIGEKTLEKISKRYPNLNKIWLLHGEGNMLISETEKSNSGPSQELLEEVKKLKIELGNKEKTINNLNISLDELREKYNELKKGIHQGRTGTEG